MKIDLNKALNQLAKAFNVAVDELYPILYKQAIIDGIYDLGWTLLFIGLITAFGFTIKYINKKQQDPCSFDWDWDEPRQIAIMIIGVVVTIVGLFVIPICLKGFVDAIFNTDYYVLKNILNQLK